MRLNCIANIFIFIWSGFEFPPCVESARILGVFPVAGKSINILYDRLMQGLLDAGHDVTVISAYKHNFQATKGSFSEVVLTGFAEDYERLLSSMNLYETPEEQSIFETKLYHDLLFNIFNQTFHHQNILNFLKEDHHFDLVIEEYLWSDSLLAFASFYKCPLVLFASMGGVNPYVNEMVGNPMPISYVPHFWMLGDYSQGMSFLERVHNLAFYLYDAYFRYFYEFPAQNQLLSSVMSNPPDVAHLFYTPSLVLLGSHSSLRQATPFAPNVVEIGGFHIDPPKKLPKDLQDFLDSAKDGAIYFSMGSHVKSKDFSPERKLLILNVFKKLKMKVLWKFEDEVLPGKPDNILIRKWVPQMDILAHPNIKLFISHGGYGSIMETIYHGKPALMIPVFGDQFKNSNHAEAHGYVLKLSYADKNFTEETLFAMVTEMLNNSKYTHRAKHLSRLFHDRPMKPLDTAIYWIEYVLRHNGADHLKVAAIRLPWYQFYMVDVFLFIASIFGITIYVFIRLLKGMFSKDKQTNKVKKS